MVITRIARDVDHVDLRVQGSVANVSSPIGHLVLEKTCPSEKHISEHSQCGGTKDGDPVRGRHLELNDNVFQTGRG